MKISKFFVSISAMLIINGCEDKSAPNTHNPKPKEIENETVIPPSMFLNVTGRFLTGGGPHCIQELLLSFQDAEGNDLVKGIEFLTNDYPFVSCEIQGGEEDFWGTIEEELYTLENIYEGLFKDFWNYFPIGLRKGKPFSTKYRDLNGNYDYLYFQTGSVSGLLLYEHIKNGTYYPSGYPFFEKVTFRLACPYILGNDEVHDINTWWKPENNTDKGKNSPICYRIEIDGKEFTEITYIYDDKLPLTYHEKTNGPYSLATIVLDK